MLARSAANEEDPIVELDEVVADFGRGMCAADSLRPQAASHRRPSRLYRPGIGPFAEDRAVALTLDQMRTARPGIYDDARKLRYPGVSTTCDLALGELPEWAIEVKLARVGRDNGTYEDAAVKKILSPYEEDRSAVTDCMKLANSTFGGRRAVLIYGFEDAKRPLAWLIDAFELIARQHVRLGPRVEAPLEDLIHPVFAAGGVFAWEVSHPDHAG
jgi:hypothetical protein